MEFIEELVSVASKRGYNPIIGSIQKKQQEWFSWFRGDVNGFHTFTQKIAGKSRSMVRQTMNLPKKICEDWVSLIWNEQCEIKIEDANTQKLVNDVLKYNNFDTQFSHLLELSMGMGMGYMIEYLEQDITKIDFINFQNALPLEWDNGRVKALVTWTVSKIDKKYITHLTYHMIKGNTYVIEHTAHTSEKNGVLGKENKALLELVYDGEPIMVFEDAYPFFQVVRPNTQNNHDIDSPHGVSIFNGMTSYFVNSDILFDLYQNESLNNKTRVIVKSDLTQTKLVVDESTGDVQYINYLDDQDTAIVSYPMENNDNQPAVQFFQGKLQFDQIGLALDKVVKFAGWRAGLGKNFYTFNEGGVNYQNEKSVITSNNDTYRTKKKHETVLREAILGMIKAILQLESLNGNYTSDIAKEEIDIIFDDSIVTNDEEIKADIFMLAEKGMIPKWRVVSHVMKMNEDDAKALVGEALADITAEQSRFMESYEDDDEGIDGDDSGQAE